MRWPLLPLCPCLQRITHRPLLQPLSPPHTLSHPSNSLGKPQPGKQVGFIHFRPSPSFHFYKSNPQAPSQLCSRLLAVTSPLSLPPFTGSYLDPDGTPCLLPSGGPTQQPSISSPSPTLSVGSKHQETHSILKPLMATPGQDHRTITKQASHSQHTLQRIREGNRNEGIDTHPTMTRQDINTYN